MCSALEEEDCEVLGNGKKLADVVACLFCNGGEGLTTVAHLHDTDSHALVVDAVGCGLPEYLLGEAAWAS